ncbi:hypothetical protein ES708_29511 [subsurface metagenome]
MFVPETALSHLTAPDIIEKEMTPEQTHTELSEVFLKSVVVLDFSRGKG